MTLALVLNSGTWELRCAGLTLAMHSLLHSRASPGAAHRLHSGGTGDVYSMGPAFPHPGSREEVKAQAQAQGQARRGHCF